MLKWVLWALTALVVGYVGLVFWNYQKVPPMQRGGFGAYLMAALQFGGAV